MSLPARLRRWTASVVLLMPLIAPVTLAGITGYQWSYLESVGWSPTRRTETQWPSLLGTGPSGWIFTVLMGMLAAACFLVARNLWAANLSLARLHSVLILLMGLAFAGVAFTADAPGIVQSSWHAGVHNLSYPVIPLTSCLGLLMGALGGKGHLRLIAAVLLPLMVVAFLMTASDEVGQLARYFAFVLIGVWFSVLARTSTYSSGGQPGL